jgi:hypothetical protein
MVGYVHNVKKRRKEKITMSENKIRYPKIQPFQCSISWYKRTGYYCHNTSQNLGHDSSPDNLKCVECRKHYTQKKKNPDPLEEKANVDV